MYSFRTTWHVAAPAPRVWEEIERVVAGEAAWWSAFQVTEPAALEPGAELGVVVRAPLGYRLRIRLEIIEVEPGSGVAARSTGDLDGAGRIEVDGSGVRFAWDVAVRRPWMRVAGPVLRPLFTFGHAVVMRAGEHGLRAALRRAPASDPRKTANPAPDPGDPTPAG